MRRTWTIALAVGLVAGCKKEPAPERLIETGWFDDTGEGGCPDRVVTTTPSEGAQQVYWRERISVSVSTHTPERYEALVVDDQQVVRAQGAEWTEGSNTFTVPLSGALAPSRDHVLRVRDCDGWHEYPFRTSALGTALEGGPSVLAGRTYQLDVLNARWVEPVGVSALLSLYFTTPILLGVQSGNAETIVVIGAPGYVDAVGQLKQDTSMPSWDFPPLPFADQPYLDAQISEINFDFGGVSIPVNDFAFRATFAPDGRSLGGGVLSGLGDTRYAGVQIGQPNNPAAVCTLSAGIGVPCVACPDGEPYCLYMVAEDVDGVYVPGLLLNQVQ